MRKLIRTRDPVFGEIEYQKPFFKPGFWKGKIDFPTLKERIDVFIQADRNKEISPEQRDYFLELRRSYVHMLGSISHVLRRTLEIYFGNLFEDVEGDQLLSEFQLQRVFIPSLKDNSALCELTYLFKMHNQGYTVFCDYLNPLYGEADD